MVFEKKVIIGSIMSFVATAVGVVAIFFPDTFNLQKKKINSFQGEISTNEQVEKLDSFLSDNFAKGSIFYLDTMVCDNRDDKYVSYDSDERAASISITTKPSKDDEPMSDDDFDENKVCYMHICGGSVFSFPKETAIKAFNFRHTNGMCQDNGDTGLRIRGYFKGDPQSGQMYQGVVVYYFENIPDKDVDLKDY